MARFISDRIVSRNGDVYEIELNFDRLAALRNSLSVDIIARRPPSDTAEAREISATLTLDPEAKLLRLEIEGEEVGTISLDAHEVSQADLNEIPGGDEDFTGRAWAALRDNLISENGNPAADAVEELIQGLPAFDPVLGCLLKGGLSATAGQIIRCYQETAFEQETVRRLRAIGICLGHNAWGVLMRASWRAVRCMALLGLA